MDAFRARSRPQEQLVQAARVLVRPMLEAGYAAGEAVVDTAMLADMVASMFDAPEELAGTECPVQSQWHTHHMVARRPTSMHTLLPS